jgi:hypothetical protein
MTKNLKFLTLCFFALLCLQSTRSLAQNIGSMTNFNGTLLYTDITNTFNANLLQASNLQPTSPAINGLIQPTGMSNNGGFLYVCQRNNPTKVYNNTYNNVGNLTINFSANAIPNPLNVTNHADLIAFIPNTNQAYVMRRRNDIGGVGGDISLVTFNNQTNAVSTGIANTSSFNNVPPLSFTFDNNFIYVTSNRNLQQGSIIVLRRDNLTEVTRCTINGFNPRHVVISNDNLIISMDNSSVGLGTGGGGASTEGRIRTIKLSTILSGSCCPDYNDIVITLPSCAPFFNSFLINAAGNQLTNILTNGCILTQAYNPTPSNASGTMALSNNIISIAANTSSSNVNVPFTISQLSAGTAVTVTLGRRAYNSAGTLLNTTTLPNLVVSGSGSFVYGDVIPPSTGGSKYEYFIVGFNWQGAVCKTMSPNIFTVNIIGCNGTGLASILQSSTTVSANTTSVSVPVTVSFNNLSPSNMPFNLSLGVRYIDNNNLVVNYPHQYFVLNNGLSAILTHNLTVNIPSNQTGRYEIYVSSFNWYQMCSSNTSNNFYSILVPCTPSLNTTYASVSDSSCLLRTTFDMPCRQGTFAVQLYPQSAGGVPFSNASLIIHRTLTTQPTGNSIELSAAGLVGTYYIRVVTSNPTVISSNYQTITIPSSEVSLLCNAIRIESNRVVLPIQVTGFTPTTATPLTVTVKREPSGQLITSTFSTLPYELIDNNPTNVNTSYTYAIVATSANICNLTAKDSCTITTPNMVCGGDLWGQDDSNDDGTECSTSPNPWESPDIWLNPSPNAFNDDTDQAPIVGDTNYVYVRVRNRGTAADAGKLRLYWAAASTGLFWPNNWTSGTCGKGTPVGGEISSTIVDNEGNIINNGDITQGVNETKIYRFAWTFPNPNDYTHCFYEGEYVQNHHFCLLARIEQPADGVCRTQNLPKNETTNLGNNVVCNNNIFWQNITILTKDKENGGNLQAGVIARTTCVTSSWFTKVGGKEENNNNTDKLYCLPLTTKFTWTEAISNNVSFFESGAGYLTVNLGQTLYDLWTAQGQQGSGISTTFGSTYINVLQDGAYILVDLAPNQAYGLLHWFIPTSTICNNHTIRLTQTACNSAGFCALIGGETFQLRNFCTAKGSGGGIGHDNASRTDLSNEVLVYPNPAQNTLNVSVAVASKATTIQATLTDLAGRTVMAAKEYSAENGNFTLDLSSLSQGVYVLEMYINSQKVTKKIVKE